jgi:hypothetical protein
MWHIDTVKVKIYHYLKFNDHLWTLGVHGTENERILSPHNYMIIFGGRSETFFDF